MDEYYIRLRKSMITLIGDLKVNRLASISNFYPNKNEETYLVDLLNYICFVTEKKVSRGCYLFFYQYFKGYKETNFDVIDDLILNSLSRRSFSFVNYMSNDKDNLTIFLDYVLANKEAVNNHRSFLLRLECGGVGEDFYNNYGLTKIFSFNDDFLFRVDI